MAYFNIQINLLTHKCSKMRLTPGSWLRLHRGLKESMEYSIGLLHGVLLDHFWSTPSESRFDDCCLVFITQSACCEPCTNNKKLHAEPSLPITNYCIVQLLTNYCIVQLLTNYCIVQLLVM